MKYYAELNAENICTGISQVKNDAKDENRAELKSYDLSVIGKEYDDGIWKEVIVEPVEEPEIDTEAETETEVEGETEPVTETEPQTAEE